MKSGNRPTQAALPGAGFEKGAVGDAFEHLGGRIAGELEDDAAKRERQEDEGERAGDAARLASISTRPGHGGADLAKAIRRPELGGDAAGQHDDETIADVEQFVEIGRNQQYAAASRPRLAQTIATRMRSRRRRARVSVAPR